MKKLTTGRFHRDDVDRVIEFIRHHPSPSHWSEDLLRRFLTQLVSTEDLVFDFHLDAQRRAVAVLLDRIQNKGNNASLEVLGYHPSVDLEVVVREAIRLAKNRLPLVRSGIEIAFHESLTWSEALVTAEGFEPYYEMHEMEIGDLMPRQDPIGELKIAGEDRNREVYEVLVRSFAENVDASIPEYEDWAGSRNRSSESRTFIAEGDSSAITGFVHLLKHPDGKGEIRTVGVLPEWRGKGLGRKMIQHALHVLASEGIKVCRLTVAVQNQNALRLYRDIGFRELERFKVYRWTRGSV